MGLDTFINSIIEGVLDLVLGALDAQLGGIISLIESLVLLLA